MEIKTKYHGAKQFEDKDIVVFKKGIPGFEELRKYILFPVEENEIFSVLHSIEDETVGLVVTTPFNLVSNYEFKLEDEILNNLKLVSEEDVLVINTVTLSSKVENITINLKAPIIINKKEKLGEQLILENDKYKVKYPLFGE